MFYAIDILLKNDKTNEFTLVWRLAHNQTLSRRYSLSLPLAFFFLTNKLQHTVDKYKCKAKRASVENIVAGIVDKTFDLRTLSYLLMGTTTLFQMQVNDFEKFVQSILIKFKFIKNTNESNSDKTLMGATPAKDSSTNTKAMHVTTPVQFNDDVGFDNLDIVQLGSEFVSAKQLKANCTAERHLQMPSTTGEFTKCSSVMQENKTNKLSNESESDFDNMPFNISIIRPPDSQSENEQGYISIAGSEYWKDDDRHEIQPEEIFEAKNIDCSPPSCYTNEDVPPPPLKRQKIGVAKIDQSIQMPLSRIRHLISDRSSLIRPDRIGKTVIFQFVNLGSHHYALCSTCHLLGQATLRS